AIIHLPGEAGTRRGCPACYPDGSRAPPDPPAGRAAPTEEERPTMSKQNQQGMGGRQIQGPARPPFLSPGTMQFLTLAGLAILIFMCATMWSDMRRSQSDLNEIGRASCRERGKRRA